MRLRQAICLLLFCLSPVALAGGVPDQAELGRGLVAIRQADGGVYLSWRLLPGDAPTQAFDVYRQTADATEHKLNDAPLSGGCCYVDRQAPASGAASYAVRPAGQAGSPEPGASAKVWEEGYLEIPIKVTEDYRPGDAAAADLTGDGRPEIVLHQSKRGRDNSFTGVTGTPLLEAYTLEGELLWRIDLGKNIREGEHYTQFLVYDLDSDGRAELVCKTADGTIDGAGVVIGDADRDWRTLQEGSQRHGRVLAGPEYLTVFDGRTGEALATVDYVPGRDPIDGWGGQGGNAGNDSYGNRCDRFLACVAYLDGQRPSAVMCRGVYGRTVAAAWDWRDGRLTQRWVFDTGPAKRPYRDPESYAGMGGHSVTVADVDQDGRDEIVYQAMVIDDNGQGLYTTGLRHGDVMWVTDIDPNRPGMEIFTVQENEGRTQAWELPGAAMRDAQTGEILWSHSPGIDVPQGVAADIDPRHDGLEVWGGPGGLRTATGEPIGRAPRTGKWTVWWDADPLRELLVVGRPTRRGRPPGRDSSARDQRRRRPRWPEQSLVQKWNPESQDAATLSELAGVSVSRGPCLMGDLLGDWREELLLVSPERDALRLFSSTIPTEHRFVTLLDDRQYRLGLVWQNVAYNTPCYPSFYLGGRNPTKQAGAD